MSVFEVGIGFSVFSVFLKSVRYLVSVFQITAIAVSVFGIFPRFDYFYKFVLPMRMVYAPDSRTSVICILLYYNVKLLE